MKFRVVNGCSSRGEVDILGVKTVESTSLSNVIRKVNDDLVAYIRQHTDPDEGLDRVLQFYGEYNEVKEFNCGVVANGEENVLYVIPENNYWFNYVDKYKGWDQQMWNQWDKFITRCGF